MASSRLEKEEKTQGGYALCNDVPSAPVSLLDQLKVKRARMAQEHNRKMKKLDRQINMLESSNAEEIIREASEALYTE